MSSLTACFGLSKTDKNIKAQIRKMVKDHKDKGSKSPDVDALNDMIRLYEKGRAEVVTKIEAAGGVVPGSKPAAVAEQDAVSAAHTTAKLAEAKDIAKQAYMAGNLDAGDYMVVLALINAKDLDKVSKIVDAINGAEEQSTGGLASRTAGSVSSTKARGKADVRRLIKMLGSQMYQGNLADVTVKEVVQNSFDAVKASLEAGKMKDGRIDVVFDGWNRTIAIRDNGQGMSKKTIIEAFLVVAGTNKEGLSEGQASGGFGMAKAAFLFGNEWVQVSTVRDGKRHTFKANGAEMFDKDIDIKGEKADKSEHGTVIIIKVPEEVEVNGEMRQVYFPSSHDSVDFFGKPMLHDNIEVLTGTMDINADEMINPSDPAWDSITNSIPIGKNQDMSGYDKYTTVRFDWGSADLWIGKDRVDQSWRTKHQILSSGIYQFNERFELRPQEMVPHNIIVNVYPSAKAEEANYPFDLKREGWKATIEADINAMKAYIANVAMGVEAKTTVDQFKNIKSLPVIDLDDVGGNKIDIKDFIQDKPKAAPDKDTQTAMDWRPPTVTVAGGTVTGVDATGQQTTYADTNKKPKEKDTDSSLQADKEMVQAKDFMIEMGVDSSKPIFHNNTSMDPFTLANDAGLSAEMFFAEIGSVMLKIQEMVGERGGYGYGSLADETMPNFVGISLDKGYHGVNLVVPFRGVLLNPLALKAKTLPGIVWDYYDTIIHEFSHVTARSHDENFISTMAQLHSKFSADGTDLEIRVALTRVVKKHQALITLLRDAYEQSTTKNTGSSLNADKGDNGVASRRGKNAADGGAQARDGERADAGQGREGQVGDRGVQGGTQYSLKDGAGEPTRVTISSVRKAFPGAEVTEGAAGFIVNLPNGKSIIINTDAEITFDREAAAEALGRELTEGEAPQGAFFTIGSDGVIQLAKIHDGETLNHEAYHAAEEMVLTQDEIAILEKKYGNAEARAVAYAKFNGKGDALFEKILNFFAQIADIFYPNSRAVFARISSGRAWNPGTKIADGIWDNDGALSVDYSVRTAEATLDELIAYNKEHGITDEATMAKYAADLRSISAIILGDPAMGLTARPDLDYEAANQYKAVKKNSDKHYVLSVDFSTICKKRVVLAATLEALQQRLGRGLTPDEIGIVRSTLQGQKVNGKRIVVSCGACYVDAARTGYGLAVNRFLNYNKQHEHLRQSFLTQKGMDALALENKKVYDQFLRYIRPQLIKVSESRTEYKQEIMDEKLVTKGLVEQFNSRSGMRWQSWSDFELPHLIDAMQVILHMNSRGLLGHTYTKVPDMIRALGQTGMMLNASLIPNGLGIKDGKLDFSPVEGMAYEEMLALREEFSETMGSIAIGVSDAHIRLLMADPTIDYIIPYHISGLPLSIRKREGFDLWVDYTEFQNETVSDAKLLAKHGTLSEFQEWAGSIAKWWDANLTGQENAQVYLAKARAWGITPKFEKFATEEGYWKTLIDRKMYNNDGEGIVQGPVRPEYDMDVLRTMLTDYVPDSKEAHAPTVDKLAEQFPAVLADDDMMTGEQLKMLPNNEVIGMKPGARTKGQERSANTITQKIIKGVIGRRKVEAGSTIKGLGKYLAGHKYLFALDKLHLAFPGKADNLLALVKKYEGMSNLKLEMALKKATPATVKKTKTAYSLAAVVADSPAFQSWFEGSKVVDADGAPLVVYHGTTRDFSEFATHNAAFFTTDNSMADTYSGDGKKPFKGGRTVPVYLSLKNPLIMDAHGAPWNQIEYQDETITTDDLVDIAKSNGHDGVIVKNLMDGGNSTYRVGDIYVAFSPTQVKSAISNTGEFSSTNPDIQYSLTEGPTTIPAVQGLVETPGTIRWMKAKKVDSTFLDRIFSTPEYYFKKFAAAGRVLKAALDRRDVKFNKEQEVLGGFVEFIKTLRKDFHEAYKEANAYLIETDQTLAGFRLKEVKGKWVVRNAQGDTIGLDGEVINKDHIQDYEPEAYAHDEVQPAVTAMIEAEGQSLREQGYTAEAIEAVKQARLLTNRGFDIMSADMLAIIATAKENGLPDPFIGDGKTDESGRYGVYAAGKKKPIAMFATMEEAEAMMANAAKMISILVVKPDGTEIPFMTELKAKAWVAKNSGKVGSKPRFANLTVRKRTDKELRPLTVQQALAQMGDLRGIYFPRVREAGEFTLIAKKEGENPIRQSFDLPGVGDGTPNLQAVINQITPIGRRAEMLKARGYTVTIKREEKTSEDVFAATNLMTAVDAILQSTMTVIDKNSDEAIKAGKHINQLLTMEIADIFKSRGYLSSRMKRLESDEIWEGYETDMSKALISYGKGVAAGTAKRDTARAMVLAFSGRDYTWAEYKQEVEDPQWDEYQAIVTERRIDEKKQPNLFRDVRSFMVDVLRNDETADRIMGTLRGLAVVKFLGFRISSATVNMTNMVMGVPATIAGLTGGSVTEALGMVIKAATVYGKYRSGKGHVSDADRALFLEITRRGWDEAQFNHEAAGELRGQLGDAWNKFTTAAMYMFGAAEKANRAMTIFAAYKAVEAKNPTADKELIWEQAKEISDRSHGVYGKETLPAWARGKYNILRLTYTFQKFQHNYMLNMIDLGFNKKEYAAVAHLLLAPALMAGTGATIASPILFAAAGALGFGGDDPEEAFYAWAEELFGGDALTRQGVFGAAGINIKGSLSMNLPMPADLGKAKLIDIAGPTGGVITDVAKGLNHLFHGELLKGAEGILPTAFGNMSKAVRESTEGVTTGNYGTVFYGDEPLKASAADAFWRFISFNPARLSGIREKQWNEKEVAFRYQDDKNEIYSKIKRQYLKGKGLTPEILKEIKLYNERVFGAAREDIKPITGKGIRTMLKRNQKASIMERSRNTE